MKKIVFTMTACFSLCTTAQETWDKVQLNPDFYSEGISAGDFNRDGHTDIVSGPFIYPGPDFTDKKTYTKPRSTPFNSSGDSDNYVHFVYDINGDGWLDILWQERWDKALTWYKNPGSTIFQNIAEWDSYTAFSVVGNESPWFTQVIGDGLPEIVCMYDGKIGLLLPDWNNPEEPWRFTAITPGKGYSLSSHGLGVGDVNNDGRIDILEKNAWWEQPESGTSFIEHTFKFNDKRYSAEGTGGAQMHVYDVDGDGDNDVITSLQAHGWGLAWFENEDGKGDKFTKHMIMGNRNEESDYGIAFAQLHALELADINGDGLLDIVTGKRKGAHGAEKDEDAVLAWFELNRSGGEATYTPHVIDEVAGVGTQILVVDINQDGTQDVLTARRAGAFVFLQPIPRSD